MTNPNPFTLSRVYRFLDGNGVPQISGFPDDDPAGNSDIEVRMRHFTEIENFTFLGYVLAHELGSSGSRFNITDSPAIISTIQGLQVPDREFQQILNAHLADQLTTEQLGDTLLDFGINWEHFVATFNTSLIPGNPLKISDVIVQEKIDSLDFITEALVSEVNLRAQKSFARK